MKRKQILSRRAFLRTSAFASLAAGTTAALGPLGYGGTGFCSQDQPAKLDSPPATDSPPNIILINADDLGYGDLGCYGGGAIGTPNIDRLAQEGVRFTEFCSCNALCSPSRFGLLTGRYPQRVGMHYVLFPEKQPFKDKALHSLGQIANKLDITDIGAVSEVDGIPDDEITVAEALKDAGYQTGMVGKWHLGDFVEKPEYNPVKHGFDSYFGVPYSNDMHPYPLCRNEEIIEADIEDQSKLTGLYTGEAVEFIERSKGNPFFFYFAHTFPHQPLYASGSFHGKSDAGRYGDTVEEIDWSVGQILDCLERNGLDENTLIFFTSDNGPWYQGNPGGLRGRKGQSYEGGFRVPMIARWPERIPHGSVCNEATMNIDVVPTILALARAELPADRIIDGKNILGLLTGEESDSPHEALFFYHHDRLEAVRGGKWKYYRELNTYVYPKPLDKRIGAAAEGPPYLYDLEQDPSESYNLYSNHPDVAQKLSDMMAEWEKSLEADPRGWKNK